MKGQCLMEQAVEAGVVEFTIILTPEILGKGSGGLFTRLIRFVTAVSFWSGRCRYFFQLLAGVVGNTFEDNDISSTFRFT